MPWEGESRLKRLRNNFSLYFPKNDVDGKTEDHHTHHDNNLMRINEFVKLCPYTRSCTATHRWQLKELLFDPLLV